MTTCRLKESERAELLLDNASLAKPASAAMAHFSQCSSCAEAWARQSSLWKALDTWEVPAVSPGFNRELYAKIDAVAALPWYERWAAAIKPVFRQPSFALAMAVAVIGVGFVFDHPTSKISPVRASVISTVQTTPAQVSNTEAEQVEKTLDDLEMLRQFDLGAEEKESVSKSM